MNGTMLQGFSWYLPSDGRHWKRLAKMAPGFTHVGITAVWMPPAYKGQGGKDDVGYGVYDTYDLGEFDQKGTVATKYGTKAELLAAVGALHKAGIEAIGDVVLNHRMGADECEQVEAEEVNPNNREEETSGPETITAWTRFTFPGRHGTYSDFTWDWNCFHGTDYDEATKRSSIWLFQGKHWDDEVTHKENGNFDYLMGDDVDLLYPPVYDELVRWGVWYVETCGLDGVRLDALKHMSREFYLRWLADVRAATKRELFCVGEYWTPDLGDLQAYLGSEEVMSLFDVPLHYKLFMASSSQGSQDLAHIFDGTIVSADPVHAVTFVENHDTQPNQALASTVEGWFKPSAYALILLREAGYPCVFYGDLFGMPNDGGIPAVKELPLLMECRRSFAYGTQRDYLDDADLIGWTRAGDPSQAPADVAKLPGGVAVVLSDRNDGAKHMCVGEGHVGETWRCVIGAEADVTIGEDGCADFDAGPGSLSVYLPAPAADALEHDRILTRRPPASA
ncbi:MAG: alpha-amylase [Atopobiaceae bacterium]|jgi:alpha-amylase|nr:alpha-amylase [Atopobiaceae bacterium]MCH4213800.1 alpha-amylase [Atopobiaceae bacterium]MCH4229795.1 alpha-amylase [Atopobiaceae bacterium]MCH4275737.1 alpha-amylase [Atopobiaceae bacterium]MCI1226699.1 alpha-amylase [Atopobiaceae bacterium]